MQQHITADRIANSIMQEEKFDGAYILVEGTKDIKVYSRLVDKNSIRVRQTHGKYKQREVYRILSERGFNSKLCVRDADFLRVPGNEKFQPNYPESIFATDDHDAEVMMANTDAFTNLLLITSSEEKIKAFEEKHKNNIRSLIFELAKPIGYLRYANKKHKLGLSFKPERPDGNKLKFKKFICDKQFKYFNLDTMINTVFEYSKNRGNEVASRDEIFKKLESSIELNIPTTELINGHDVSEITSIVITKGLQSDSNLIQDQASVESSLTLAYELRHFHESKLYLSLQTWGAANGINVITN